MLRRIDFFHMLSLRPVREFDMVGFEDSNVAGRVKNHHLGKSISDGAFQSVEGRPYPKPLNFNYSKTLLYCSA